MTFLLEQDGKLLLRSNFPSLIRNYYSNTVTVSLAGSAKEWTSIVRIVSEAREIPEKHLAIYGFILPRTRMGDGWLKASVK